MKPADFGRFEKSFTFHMMRDFFLLLVLVAAVEMGVRYASMTYEFKTTEQEKLNKAAQQLADDVKAIMLNSGGPVAAQTVYPILDRNYQGLGLAIAVVPSPATVESIQQTFKFKPLGLQPKWEAGEHKEASITLHAEQFCLGCHIKARVGDVLGTVSVRSYLKPKEDAWWNEISLMASALSIKIILHTIVLFLLLKVRMEPLLSLRSTTAALAKGVMNLSPRATVKSTDEFGELAADLNHFLDRVKLIVHDLDKILSEVVSAGERITLINRELEQQIDGLREAAIESNNSDVQRALHSQLIAAREMGSFEIIVQTLDELVSAKLPNNKDAQDLKDKLEQLRASFLRVSNVVKDVTPAPVLVDKEASQYLALSQALREMALLEGSMQKVAEAGRTLVQRLENGRGS
ncbi:MAG: HAMP domain-containing protein [Burkholderiaceae bacterium]|jgi:methyl-accepting chemotaxis protein